MHQDKYQNNLDIFIGNYAESKGSSPNLAFGVKRI